VSEYALDFNLDLTNGKFLREIFDRTKGPLERLLTFAICRTACSSLSSSQNIHTHL
jgi:hypothetical protein